jgi:hypothetical protein
VADRRRDRASIPAAISRTAPVMMFWYEGGSSDREHQDVARAEVELRTAGCRREEHPAHAPNAEQIVNAVTLMWMTSIPAPIPARRAASTLPPVANRCRPHVVRFKAIVVTTIRSG